MKRQLILPSKHLRVLLSGGVKTSQLSTAFFPCYLCHLLQVAVAPAPEPCGREISFSFACTGSLAERSRRTPKGRATIHRLLSGLGPSGMCSQHAARKLC
jgi:hypothetical protein